MNIDLKPEQRQLLELLIEQGYYQSQEEAIEQALNLLAQDISQDAESGLYSLDERESNTQLLADLETSMREHKAGVTQSISELWDDIEN